MRPEFGCIIWDLLMDPLIASTKDIIEEDITRIVERDPRVKLVDISILDLDHTIRADVTLNYVETNTPEILYLSYDRKNREGLDR
jgi:phage baseplate assembly protein W